MKQMCLMVVTISSLLLFGTHVVSAQSDQGTPPPNTPPDIISITLDTSVVYQTCVSGSKSLGQCEDKPPRVMVTVEATDKENDILTFTYQVKTGRIVGQGKKGLLGPDRLAHRYSLYHRHRRRRRRAKGSSDVE